ncbi:MAG: hypothetical protein ACK2VA_22500 [Anaerolineae bacterium]
MDWKRVVEPGGLNWWIVAAGIGTNFLLIVVLFALLALLRASGLDSGPYLLLACGGSFSIAFLTAYLCGHLAGERYLSYAFYPLAGFLVPVVPGILLAGGLALLLAGFGLLGAWNGALLLQRRAAHRRDAIYRSFAQDEPADKNPAADKHPMADQDPANTNPRASKSTKEAAP